MSELKMKNNLIENMLSDNSLIEENKDLKNKLLFFLVWPFGAWLYCLRSADRRTSYIIFFLFSLLLCWHMSPNGGDDLYDDFIGIMEEFQSTLVSTDQFLTDLKGYFTFSIDAPKELYRIFSIWFVKLFTDNYHFYFLFCSIPVAIFQLKSMEYITSSPQYAAGTLMGILIIALFILPRDIITVQNPRFATGLWYCVYFSIWYYSRPKRNPLFFLLIFIAPLFHAAIWLFVGIFLLSLSVPVKGISILEKVALCSIIFSFFDNEFMIGTKFTFLPDSLQIWVNGYMSESSFARVNGPATGFGWLGITFRYLQKISYVILTVQMIKSREEEKKNDLYKFYLVVFTIINLIQFVPELSTRYYHFIAIFGVYLWFNFFGGDKKKERAIYFVAIVFLWTALFRYGYFFGGALRVNTPPDIFITPLPYLIGKGLWW